MGINFGDRASPIVTAAESPRRGRPQSRCGASLHWQIRKAETDSIISSPLHCHKPATAVAGRQFIGQLQPPCRAALRGCRR
eukprot:364481-Chlamydomonas_euryale.AAC.23